MTQDQFIEYLHDNDCSLNEDGDGLHYKCRRRNYEIPIPQVTLPIIDKDEEVAGFIACFVCYCVKVEIPQEYTEYYKNEFLPIINSLNLKV